MRVDPRTSNYLAQLLASGQISDEDLTRFEQTGVPLQQGPQFAQYPQRTRDALTGDSIEPAPSGNALAALIQQAGQRNNDVLVAPQSYSGATGQPTPAVNGDFQVYAGAGRSPYRTIEMPQEARGQAANPQMPNDAGPMVRQALQANQPKQRTIPVFGSGNGTTAQLGPEAIGQVELDYSRPKIDVPGVGKAVYGKDGNAYVMGSDGPVAKVILGHDMQGSMALNKANLERQKTEGEIAHTQEAIRASQAQTPDISNLVNQSSQGLLGEDFLKTIDPTYAATIRQIAAGKMAPPTGMVMKTGYGQILTRLLTQYDPNYDATAYAERMKTAQGYSPAGKQGGIVTNINNALKHAGELADVIPALNNSDFAPGIVNPVVNTVEQKLLGDPRQGTFTTIADALSNELNKVYSGGGGSLAQLRDWQRSFDPNAGQKQQEAYLRTAMNLLEDAISTHKAAYEKGMGPRANFGNLLDPRARAALQRFGRGDLAGGDTAPTDTTTANAGSIDPRAIAYLKARPDTATYFDQKYGQGAAARILGQ